MIAEKYCFSHKYNYFFFVLIFNFNVSDPYQMFGATSSRLASSGMLEVN